MDSVLGGAWPYVQFAIGLLAGGAGASLCWALAGRKPRKRLAQTDPSRGPDRIETAVFEEALNSLSQGVVLFDEKRDVVFCNTRYMEIYGLTPDQVAPGTPTSRLIKRRLELGLKVPYDPDEYVRDRMSKPIAEASAVHEFADGRIIAYTSRPLCHGGGIATHDDITEREELHRRLTKQHELAREQEDQLRVRNLQFDMAINNMTEGLCFFDGAQRLLVCNRRYIEMYGLEPDRIRPGMNLREIIDLRFEAGSFPAMSQEEYHHWRSNVAVSASPSDTIVELKNGRVFEIHHRPMPDLGWVATHDDITEQRRSEVKIAYMAQHDALTGLANRALLNESLERALAQAQGSEMVAVHLIDLDQFKPVNDTMGHPAGDKLLKMVAGRLRGLAREADTIARMGGDEFAIVQVAIADPADAIALARRITEVVGEPYDIEGHPVVIGASVGIAVGPGDGRSTDVLVRNADLALYRAKADGRGTFRFFEPEMDAQVQARSSMEQELRRALPGEEFELHYQPVVDLASNRIGGFEALLRWRHGEKGMLNPSTFIPAAEQIGLIVPLGEWVIRQACATAARWPDDLKVAVNLSPSQFRNVGLLQVIVGALAASGLRADRLEVEITETTLLQDSETTLEMLYQLRSLGVRIALDDFGTGYSSLSYLQRFPFDKIKIDRSFVKNIADNVGSLTIVRAVAELATALGMTTTAEGVETQEQLEKIASVGCTEMQGFLFSPPRPAAEIERLFLATDREPKARDGSIAA